jgi:hypothetical protein
MKAQTIILTLGLSSALIGLTGCNKADTSTAGTSTDTTTNSMATDIKQAGTNAVIDAQKAGEAVAAGAEKAGTEIKDATTNAVAEVKDKMESTNPVPPATNTPSQ